ncbi:MAG TPA: deoxyguanosinetriphosphate triphosphohydrolase [Deltaproteobacteria bacterium]|nr:MAG: deoxyguanosinetriphosphate triphosphohydrolase [Deltaproteobacteria bacterium GWD2_42_10]OGP48850.1 MAG: deoxyguanosinetriphosphate triphosphohydrolase [Deltaproteobacteria bacterium GWF2_42_12]HAG51337.1 deoxyguanosinetriphosphate triphosphohydrolase [Deltaproteobacteria bacterium]HCY19424.1 deoxyguanosinetriphosphate triphosphohydrolase [Deltaproteobacteria bacterium]
MAATPSIADIEAKRLALYAMHSKDSRGRRYKETEHPFRTAFQRDRDRIIHCNAFRRLEYKTQVFVYHEGDHYRTRLTHTIEVAQISRTIARTLNLNEELSEAIALAHDLGHPPFGHTGEKTLAHLMKGHGSFEHNLHSLRIVEYLERRYPNFKGLNLTWELREGIVKHSSEHDRPEVLKEYEPEKEPCLEAQIVDLADEIAYNNHDIDDGLSSEMINAGQLKDVELWQENYERIKKAHPKEDFKIHKSQTVIQIINQQVTDLIAQISKEIEKRKIGSVQDIRDIGESIARFSPEMNRKNTELKKFLKKNLYSHHRVIRMSDKADRILKALFKVYLDEPQLLPPHVYADLEEKGKERLICDYIAGMTDRFALDEYKKLFDPYERV